MKQAILGAAVLCLLAVVSTHQASAEPQTLIYGTGGLYSVHVAHVGDSLVVRNDDISNHTVTGKASTGEIVSSGTIKPGQNFTMSFMFPAQFSFYDQYHQGNIGVFYIYNPEQALPQNIYNHTSTSDLFETPQYFAGSDISFGESNATIAFGISNGTNALELTQPVMDTITPVQTADNATVASNDTVAYWKSQAETYKSKYDTLLAAIKLLIG